MAAAAPYVGPDPGAGQYSLYKAQADTAYANAQAQISNQRGSFLQGQGLTGQYDASGNYTGFAVDGSNPGGAYQQLQGADASAMQRSDAALGAIGFGGGLAQQHHEAAQNAVSQNAADWATNAQGQLAAYGQQGTDASNNYQGGLYQDFLGNMKASIDAGQFNPASYVGLDIPGYGTFTADDAKALGISLGIGTPASTTPPPAWKPPKGPKARKGA